MRGYWLLSPIKRWRLFPLGWSVAAADKKMMQQETSGTLEPQFEESYSFQLLPFETQPPSVRKLNIHEAKTLQKTLNGQP